MLMWFFVGDEREFAEGYSANASIPLWKQPFVVALADFSLHLTPIDLDLLSEEACRIVGVQPVTLTDSLTANVWGDGEASSSDVVSPQWVQTNYQLKSGQTPLDLAEVAGNSEAVKLLKRNGGIHGRGRT